MKASKPKKLKSAGRLFALSLVLGLSLIVSAGPAAAAAKNSSNTSSKSSSGSSGENITQAVTQSYDAGAPLQLGMIVQLKPGDASTVIPLTQKNLGDMLGVTVSQNGATITLTPQATSQQQVFVATSGRYDVLVSTQNGAIKSGDYVTISSLTGVGMKADTNETVVLGKAAAPFTGSGSDVSSTTKLQNSQGKTVTVALGTIPVDIDISHNPLLSKATDYVPSFLSKAAVTVASRPVSAARIYLGLVTLLVTALLTGNVMYSGVRSGMLAIGRNPLSKKSIIRSLIQTVIAGLIIFIIGIFAVYLLLKL